MGSSIGNKENTSPKITCLDSNSGSWFLFNYLLCKAVLTYEQFNEKVHSDIHGQGQKLSPQPMLRVPEAFIAIVSFGFMPD